METNTPIDTPTTAATRILSTAPLGEARQEPPLRTLSRLADPIHWAVSRTELNRYMKREGIPAVVSAISDYTGSGIYKHMVALHDPRETEWLAGEVMKLRPRVILEIGTCFGGSLFVWSRTNPQAELLISMDLPGGLYGGGYDARRLKMYRHFVADRPNTAIELMRCNSHDPANLDTVRALLKGRPVDFLFIDGDHTYDGVSQDFEMYSPLVRPGGLVAFHDINTLATDHAVWKFWRTLKTRNRSTAEKIAEPNGDRYGIGVIHW